MEKDTVTIPRKEYLELQKYRKVKYYFQGLNQPHNLLQIYPKVLPSRIK